MPISRFFYAGELAPDSTITLDRVASHHLLNVLRLAPGEKIRVFNGRGGEYEGYLIDTHQKLARVGILTFHSDDRESPLFLELGQAISRNEKMDYAIQKAVELGVTKVVPLITERCSVKLKKDREDNRMAHWRGIIVHACEQSGRCRLPEISTPLPLTTWLNSPHEGLSLLCDPEEKNRLADYSPSNKIRILIGPEGGLAPAEISQAKAAGFKGLSLGPRILRTETAAVVILSLLQNQWGAL